MLVFDKIRIIWLILWLRFIVVVVFGMGMVLGVFVSNQRTFLLSSFKKSSSKKNCSFQQQIGILENFCFHDNENFGGINSSRNIHANKKIMPPHPAHRSRLAERQLDYQKIEYYIFLSCRKWISSFIRQLTDLFHFTMTRLRKRHDKLHTKNHDNPTKKINDKVTFDVILQNKTSQKHWKDNMKPESELSTSSTSSLSKYLLLPQIAPPRNIPKGKYNSFFKIEPDHEEKVLVSLKNSTDRDNECESGIGVSDLPKHIGVIMDGNRRYGKQQYNGDAVRGHWDGSRKLLQMIKWCIAEQIQVLTVYALSTENWNRSTTELAALLSLIQHHCDEFCIDAVQRNITVKILSTDRSFIPLHIQECLDQLEYETRNCSGGLILNICLSYSGRNEILAACQSVVNDATYAALHTAKMAATHPNDDFKNPQKIQNCANKSDGIGGNGGHNINVNRDKIQDDKIQQELPSQYQYHVTEEMFAKYLQTSHCHPHNDPDLIIRTSGEMRISNFMLWQVAYSELYFLSKNWPELTKDDFLHVLRDYVHVRQRRFGI